MPGDGARDPPATADREPGQPQGHREREEEAAHVVAAAQDDRAGRDPLGRLCDQDDRAATAIGAATPRVCQKPCE